MVLMINKEEIYPHERLWRSSNFLFEKIKNDPDNDYLILPTLVTICFAYEAFINFSGYLLLPEVWIEEKNNFLNKGIEDKVDAITKILPDYTWTKGERPYQTIKKLWTFRNIAVHGKIQFRTYERDLEAFPNFIFEHEWDRYLKKEFVIVSRTDVKQFCQTLVVAMRIKLFDEPRLCFDAFEGPRGFATGEATK
jgi:hypothetical protein